MIAKSQELEERALATVAELACLAARTAPKGRGVDELVAMTVDAREKDMIAEEMRRIAKEYDAPFFERDANCVDKAPLVILLGQKVPPRGVAPCGFCGYKDCADNAQHNGVCAVGVSDLGIAVGSAVSVLAQHHVDNRVMFTIGRATLNLDIFDEDVRVVYGIPLSVSSKSPFFDRG